MSTREVNISSVRVDVDGLEASFLPANQRNTVHEYIKE